MAEAFGSIVIKAPDEIIKALSDDDEGVEWSAVSELFEYAGVGPIKESHPMLEYSRSEDGFFPHEGIELKGDYLEISIFGDEWMFLSQAIVKKGNGMEWYGVIEHEYGQTEYYALDGSANRYVEMIDFEGDVNVDRQDEILSKWKSLIPKALVDVFSDDELEDQ